MLGNDDVDGTGGHSLLPGNVSNLDALLVQLQDAPGPLRVIAGARASTAARQRRVGQQPARRALHRLPTIAPTAPGASAAVSVAGRLDYHQGAKPSPGEAVRPPVCVVALATAAGERMAVAQVGSAHAHPLAARAAAVP